MQTGLRNAGTDDASYERAYENRDRDEHREPPMTDDEIEAMAQWYAAREATHAAS